MSAQIGDIYKYQGKEYTVVALSSSIMFDPKDFGLEPHASSSACWRGYWCEYSIENDEIKLKDLYLFNRDNNYPPLNGKEVSPQEFEELECYGKKRKKPKKATLPAHFGHRHYKDVDMPIAYTGRILLGDGFMQEYYIHMGFQRGWAYRKLIELVFEEGILLECNDLSHIAKTQREAIKANGKGSRYPDDGDIPTFVDECFSLDYADKAWWL